MQPEALHRLRQRADRLAGLARELAAATPQRSQGSDLTGWVLVVLGPDGFPEEIRIRDGWQHRLGPGQLGAAVVQAHSDAVRQAIRAWTNRLDDIRWWRRQRDVDEFPDVEPPAASGPSLPGAGRVHHDVEFSEQVLRILQATRHPTVEGSPSVMGTDGGRHVIVRLGAGGMTGCEIEPRWAGNCGGAAINVALDQALSRAKNDVAGSGTGQFLEVDAALRDALATLSALTDGGVR